MPWKRLMVQRITVSVGYVEAYANFITTNLRCSNLQATSNIMERLVPGTVAQILRTQSKG
jgi:hypothetical protein